MLQYITGHHIVLHSAAAFEDEGWMKDEEKIRGKKIGLQLMREPFQFYHQIGPMGVLALCCMMYIS